MPKSFGQIKYLVNHLGGNLKPYHLSALKKLGKNGAIIYERELAEALLEITEISPNLIKILKDDLKKYSLGRGQMPYFVCHLTLDGKSFCKMV